MLGNSGGGIIAVLMSGSGLFAPLWVGAGIMVIAAITTHVYMIEPGDERLEQGIDEKLLILADDEEIIERPPEIDKKTMWNIVGGAVSIYVSLESFLFYLTLAANHPMHSF